MNIECKEWLIERSSPFVSNYTDAFFHFIKIVRKITLWIHLSLITVATVNRYELPRSFFDKTGEIKVWASPKNTPRLPVELIGSNNEKFLIVVDDGVTIGASCAVSFASSLSMYLQARVEVVNGSPVLRRATFERVRKVIDGRHIFASAGYKVIHITIPKCPIFLGNSEMGGLGAEFIHQVGGLLGFDQGVYPRILGVVLMGLQADSKYISGAALTEAVTVESIEMALEAKLNDLHDAWSATCAEGRAPGEPPFVLGVLGAGTQTLHVRENAQGRFFTQR
jgi:hypothetical protein